MPSTEAGSTRVRVSAHALDGRQIATAERRLSSRARRVTEAVVSAAAKASEDVRGAVGDGCGPLRQVVIAAPTLPSEDRPTEITVGALSDHAPIQGAVHTAITRALDRMI